MTGPACRHIRQALGVYVLGAIGPAERAAVDTHLGTCADCREELAGLAGLPALLGRVPASDAERLITGSAGVKDLEDPPAELLTSLLKQVAGRRAAGRWRGIAAAAAAAVIAVAGGAAAARIVMPGQHTGHQSRIHAAAEWVRAVSPRTHVSAVISYSATSWGTKMDVWVRGIPAGTACQLWVTDASGDRWPAGSWTVAHGHADVGYSASVSLFAAQVRGFEIVSHGHVLITVPAT